MDLIQKIDRDIWAQWDEWAQQLEPGIRKGFLDAMAALKEALSVSVMTTFLASGDMAALARHVTEALGNLDALSDVLKDSIVRGGTKVAASLPDRIIVRFDRYNPEVIERVNREALQFVQQITNDVRDSLVDIVRTGLSDGIGPGATAQRIKSEIGLTQRQRKAVDNFRRMLAEGDRTVLTRELRDRRFDRTLEQVFDGRRKLTADEIRTMTDRYAERYIKHRAEVIARTESIRAQAVGNAQAWAQAVQQNPGLRQRLRRRWYVAPSEGPSSHKVKGKIGGKPKSGKDVVRLCPICRAIPGMNSDGRQVDEPFQTPNGPTMYPPIHPNCRCVVFTGVV